MKKSLKRIISLLLAFNMALSYVPVLAHGLELEIIGGTETAEEEHICGEECAHEEISETEEAVEKFFAEETVGNAFEGKVISILGDSISTFAGYIPVADGTNLAHAAFYPKHDVTAVEHTWWIQVITNLGAKLGINESWSGSRVLNTIDGNSGNLGEDAAMASLTRIKNLGSNGIPDVILFFGGTNDIAFDSPIGSFDSATAPEIVDLTATKWETYAEAYTAAIMRMQYYYPNAEIVAMFPTENKSYYDAETLGEYTAVMKAICEHYGAEYLDLMESGFTTSLLADVTHPSAAGHTAIAGYVIDLLNKLVEKTEEDSILEKSTFTSTSDAVAYVRSQMVARVRPITVTISGAALSETEVNSIINSAFEHTGVPNEGDYLLANKVGQTVTVETGTDENGDYTTITADINWISSAEQEAEVDAAVEAVLNELDLWNKTDYEKIKGAYDWITENVQYDWDWDDTEPDPNYHKHSTHAAIIDKEAVCQGYASLYYRFMLELGIDCRYISGEAGYVEPESHAWNIVRLEGKYYNMDATWDRDLMGHYRMFLCTEANFTEHIRDGEYATADFYAKYPMAVVPYVFNVTASGKLSNGMEWVLDGDTGTLTVAGKGAIPSYRYSYAPWYNYRESVKSIVVSEGITEVGERAFYWCTNCTSLTLPQSLVTIREYGFNNLRALEEVTLPSNLKTMEFCAFSECVALKSITIPDSVTTVGTSAFSNCYGLQSAVIGSGIKQIPNSMFFGDKNLRKVTLPEGLTYIGDTAFADCGLNGITLPKTLTGLGSSVFSGNRTMTMIYVEEGNTVFKDVSGVLFSIDGKRLICYPAGKISFNYTVPVGTEVIARSAFNDVYRLEHVYFPDSLREIEAYAFAYSNLWSVTLNENITKVGDSAFRSCKNLYSVIFENQSVNLVGYTFADCTNLQIAYLPKNITEIPNGLFDGCIKLEEVTIPSTVTKIGSSAFLDCDALTSITIPGSVKSIGQQAFDFCQNLKTIIFEDGIQSLGWLCIRNNPNLTKVVIPDSVTTFVQPSNSSSKTFENCPKVVLYVKCGSTAYYYAKNRGLSMSLTHNYANKTTVAPTCTAMGYTLYTCYCGASYRINDKDALGHSYKTEVIEPTCTEQGYTVLTCTRCGYSYKANYTAEKGHTVVIVGYVEPTCTESGYSGDRICEVCGITVSSGAEIPAAGHAYETTVTAPTCTKQGYTTHSCSVCGDSYVDSYVEAKGHSFGEWTVETEPKWEENGIKIRICTVCLKEEREEIPSLIEAYPDILHGHLQQLPENIYAHTNIWELLEPENEYFYGGTNWGTLNEVVSVTIPISEGDKIYASSFERGIRITYFDENGVLVSISNTDIQTEFFENGYITVPAGAIAVNIPMWDNSSENVLKILTLEQIECEEHSFGQWKTEVEAGLVSKGTMKRSCENCGFEETKEVPELMESGYYSYSGEGASIELPYRIYYPSSYENGEDKLYPVVIFYHGAGSRGTDNKAQVLNKKLVDRLVESDNCIVIAPQCAEGHQWVNTPWGNGSYDSNAVDESIFLNASLALLDEMISAEKIDEDYVYAAGLSMGGYATWSVIMEYPEKFAAAIPICGAGDPSKANDILGVAIWAFHGDKDTTVPVSGSREMVEAISNLGGKKIKYTEYEGVAHDSWVNAFAEPELLEWLFAQKKHIHVLSEWIITTEPTCTEKGEERRECESCGYSETREVEAKGHDYEAVVTEPTCTEQGYTTYTCRCGESYVDDYVEAKGHTEVIDKAVEPTCTETGLTDGKHCSVCGEVIVAQTVVPAKGHDYKAVVTEPTCTDQGYTTHTCSLCGDSYVDSYVNATGHSFGEWYETKAPTAAEKGEERRDCVNCDYYEVREIGAIAVLYGDVNGDGRVNVLDANLIRRYAARLVTFDDSQLIAADVNGDERVNVLDANLVRRFAARLIDKFPIEEK